MQQNQINNKSDYEKNDMVFSHQKAKKMYIFWKIYRGESVDAVALFFHMILSKEFFRKEDSFSMF